MGDHQGCNREAFQIAYFPHLLFFRDSQLISSSNKVSAMWDNQYSSEMKLPIDKVEISAHLGASKTCKNTALHSFFLKDITLKPFDTK